MIPEPTVTRRIPPTLSDSFEDARRPGNVIGSQTSTGITRQGVDSEGALSIDNGALRIRPLLRPGWGKAALTYGPYAREDGLLLAVHILNGHNTSQSEPLPESITRRLQRWLRGPDVDSAVLRLWQLARWPYRWSTPRRFWSWALSTQRFGPPPRIDENLALGWFAHTDSGNAPNDGCCFIMHAGGPNNGELWAWVGKAHQEVATGVPNVPMWYAVVLRKKGAAYYAATDIATVGNSDEPISLRPVAIDPWSDESTVYGGLHQSVLGQIGFRVDTRVYTLHIEQSPALSQWYGTAHFADSLSGHGALHNSVAEVGSYWLVSDGQFVRTDQGIRSSESHSSAHVSANTPSGLIHVLFSGLQTPKSSVQLLWRFRDVENHWRVTITPEQCSLDAVENGTAAVVAFEAADWFDSSADATREHSLQVQDDGASFSVHLNGKRLFDRAFEDVRLADSVGLGIGVAAEDDDVRVRSLEAHPHQVSLPINIRALDNRLGTQRIVAIHDDFEGPAGDLANSRPSLGEVAWQRSIGSGQILLTGEGTARVDASVERPAPGRIVYTLPWTKPELAELEIGVIPPGSERGQAHRGRAGVVFWQDERNYIIVSTWLDDHYGGSSISSFFRLDGFEEIYDAVWTNISRKVMYGVPCRLSAMFDGTNYAAFVDGEAVLYRALTDVYSKASALRINRVGIVANWEWGTDTGSIFTNFTARG